MAKPDTTETLAVDTPANEPHSLADLEKIKIGKEMPTAELGKGVLQARRIEGECASILESRLRLFLQNLIGPAEHSGGLNMYDCKIYVTNGVVNVRNLYGIQNLEWTRQFYYRRQNLFGTLMNTTGLVDNLDITSKPEYVSFTVPVERFDRIVAGGHDAIRDAYPLVLDKACGEVGAKVETAVSPK